MDQPDFDHIKNSMQGLISQNSHFSLTKIKGGKNNQLWLFDEISNDNTKIQEFVVKIFFEKTSAFDREFYFYQYFRNLDLPLPDLIHSLENNYIIFSHIENDKKNLINLAQFVSESSLFFNKINNYYKTNNAYKLNAKDAFFSVFDQIDNIENKIIKLIECSKTLNEIQSFLKSVYSLWNKLKIQIEDAYIKKYYDITKHFSHSELCVSPSDFGMHNSIYNDKKFYFIDFEYAGMDDPAKMICDFFHQPQFKIELGFYDKFVDKSLQSFSVEDKDKIVYRSKLMFFAYSIKWISITLNILEDNNSKKILFNDSNVNFYDLINERISLSEKIFKNIPQKGIENESFRSWLRQ